MIKLYVIVIIIVVIIAIYLITRFTPVLNFRFNRDNYDNVFGGLLKASVNQPDMTTTPNLLFQTYKDKSKIPKEVYETIAKYAPEYTHIILDDKDGTSFLTEYFEPVVLETFNKLKLGPHKADLLRYCLLYVYGGVYMDISTELMIPLSTLFADKTVVYTVLAGSKDHIYQGVICTPPSNPLFLSLIYYIVKKGNPLFYHDFCKDFLYQINKELKYFVKPGLNISDQGNKYYLLREQCSFRDCSMCDGKFDKYGLCCIIYDKNIPVIKTRRASYPW